MIRRSWRLARVALQLEAELRVGFVQRERQRMADEAADAAWQKALSRVRSRAE